MLSKRIFCALVLGILLTEMAIILNTAKGVTTASLYIDPPKVEGTTYIPPKTFSINILVANVSDLSRLRFNMSFSPKILGILNFFVGALGNLPSPSVQVDGNKGFLWLDVNYNLPISTVSSVAVMNVTFLIRGRGATSLDLHDTGMYDSSGQPISHTVGDGFFRNFDEYDLNFDGKVDLDDLIIVARAFGSFLGHPRWNRIADVNNSGMVDIFDLTLVASHFGRGL